MDYDLSELRDQYVEALSTADPLGRLYSLRQLFLDLMDYYEQSDEESLYAALEKIIHEQMP